MKTITFVWVAYVHLKTLYKRHNMAERQAENQNPEDLNQLENQVKDIQLEIDQILMAPRQEQEVKKAATTNEEEGGENDLAGKYRSAEVHLFFSYAKQNIIFFMVCFRNRQRRQ